MGTYVSDLSRGKIGWWEKRPVPLRILCEILNVSEFRITGAVRSSDETIKFSTFPDLTPLNPFQDDLPPGMSFHLEGAEVPGGGLSPPTGKSIWFHVPPGLDAAVVSEWLRVKLGRSSTTLLTLNEALDTDFDVSQCVLRVDFQTPDSDFRGIRKLAGIGAVVVASFTLDRALRSYAAESRERNEEREDSFGKDWLTASWSPEHGWRRELLLWIEDRLDADTVFVAGPVAQWLDQRDPNVSVFSSPSSIFSLAAYIHQEDVLETEFAELDPEDVAKWWLGKNAPDKPVSEVRREWLEDCGVETFYLLTRLQLERLDTVLGEPHSEEEWLGAIPTPLHSGRLSERAIQEITNEIKCAGNNKDAYAVISKVERLSSRDILNHLRGSGLLREVLPGKYRLEPVWLRTWLEQKLIKDEFEETPGRWGRFCLDPQRLQRVDECFDQIPADSLLNLAERAAHEFSLDSLEAIAKVETLFAACSRRLVSDPDSISGRSGTLEVLATCQLQVFELDCLENMGPLTRPIRDRFEDFTIEWKLGCWAWSVEVEAPEGFEEIDIDVEGLFPGWCQPQIGRKLELGFDRYGARLPSDRELVEGASLVIRKVWETYERPGFGDRIPEVFLPHIWDDYAAGRLEIAAHQEFLPRRAFATDFLKLADHLEPAEKARLCQFLLDSFQHKRPQFRLDSLVQQYGDFARWCIDQMSLERFAAMLEEQGLKGTVTDLSLVPARLRPAIYAWCLEHPDKFRSHDFFKTLRPQQRDVDGLVRLVEKFAHEVRPAARMVWALDPDRAMAEAQQVLQGDYSVWLGCSPPSQRRRVLEVIGEMGRESELGGWVKRWVRRQIPDAGLDANLAFEVYRDVWADHLTASGDG